LIFEEAENDVACACSVADGIAMPAEHSVVFAMQEAKDEGG
jgi:hypothetical protein